MSVLKILKATFEEFSDRIAIAATVVLVTSGILFLIWKTGIVSRISARISNCRGSEAVQCEELIPTSRCPSGGKTVQIRCCRRNGQDLPKICTCRNCFCEQLQNGLIYVAPLLSVIYEFTAAVDLELEKFRDTIKEIFRNSYDNKYANGQKAEFVGTSKDNFRFVPKDPNEIFRKEKDNVGNNDNLLKILSSKSFGKLNLLTRSKIFTKLKEKKSRENDLKIKSDEKIDTVEDKKSCHKCIIRGKTCLISCPGRERSSEFAKLLMQMFNPEETQVPEKSNLPETPKEIATEPVVATKTCSKCKSKGVPCLDGCTGQLKKDMEKKHCEKCSAKGVDCLKSCPGPNKELTEKIQCQKCLQKGVPCLESCSGQTKRPSSQN